jgi:hypothetical protein
VKKLELTEVISIEIEVVDAFHFEAEWPLESPSRIVLRFERSNDSMLEGVGSTGPTGGHLVRTREGKIMTEKTLEIFILKLLNIE